MLFLKELNQNNVMEIISKEKIQELLQNNIFKFSSTHARLSLPIINRIYKKMINGIKFDDIKICDNLIIDGHHRYISSVFANKEIGATKTLKTSATMEYHWNDVEFLEEEWDTEEKIKRLNEMDAAFNNISIEEIIEMIK